MEVQGRAFLVEEPQKEQQMQALSQFVAQRFTQWKAGFSMGVLMVVESSRVGTQWEVVRL